MAEHISMRFPADTAYIGAVRLAVSGIADKIGFGLDEIEDLKSCIAEAFLLLSCDKRKGSIGIEIGAEARMSVTVEAQDAQAGGNGDDCEDFSGEISRLMIGALSENAEFRKENGVLCSISFEKECGGH